MLNCFRVDINWGPSLSPFNSTFGTAPLLCLSALIFPCEKLIDLIFFYSKKN